MARDTLPGYAPASKVHPMPDNEYIGFKEMCARFDVTPRTLRYYEYI